MSLSGDPRRWALLGVVLITGLVAMESTVVSTAMPRTVAELGEAQHIAWVFTAFTGALAITGPLWGYLADRYGARPAYISSVVLFLIGSSWAAASHSMRELVMARFVQGLGGGGLTPLGQTVLSLIYFKKERADAQAYVVSAFGVASIFGPPLGGWITQALNWRWVFILPIPIGLLGGLMIFYHLHPPAGEVRQMPFDWLGLFIFISWMLITLRATDNLDFYWLSSALLVGAVMLFYSWRRQDPFLPVPLLHYRVFAGASLLAPLVGSGIFGAVSFFPLFLQHQFGLGDQQAGQAMLPLMLGWTLCSGASARLSLRFGYAATVGASCFGMLFGYAMLSWQQTVWAVALGQIGLAMAGGLSFTPLTLSVQDQVPRQELGQATSAIVFLRTLGAALGTAIMGAVWQAYGFVGMFHSGLIMALLGLMAFIPYHRSLCLR